ncbi:MAG: ABC transporter substrate-binding protein [Cyanobacteria bacterium P01_D01_bin.105]
MKRRWFLAGLALSAAAGCQSGSRQTGRQPAEPDREGRLVSVDRDEKTLVVATSANYPPYEYLKGGESGGNDRESRSRESSDRETDGQAIIGFDIDLAGLIAEQLGRELSVVDLEFGSLIPALVNDEVDMVIAALEPNRSRKQKVDFTNIYYRSRQALISYEGYLRARDLNYQSIGIRAGSVQDRFADRISAEYPDIDVIRYDTISESLEALEEGLVEGVILEATIAKTYLSRYPDLDTQMMPSDRPTGSAIALPKNSSLRREINTILSSLKANGEMERLIKTWFS